MRGDRAEGHDDHRNPEQPVVVERVDDGSRQGDPKTAAVYFGMTVVMSSLPLVLIGGIGYWLYRHHS